MSVRSCAALARISGYAGTRFGQSSRDSAVAESFFATIKKELVHRRSWPTRRELTSGVVEYIESLYKVRGAQADALDARSRRPRTELGARFEPVPPLTRSPIMTSWTRAKASRVR